jgi:internalin A
MANIEREQQEIEQSLKNLPILLDRLNQLNQQSELIGRNFTRLWNLEMHKMEVDCPNTFILMPGSDNIFNPKNWVSQLYWLYLVCQHPPGPHRVGNGYRLRKAEEWWVAVVPWLNHLITFLKFAVPMGEAFGQVYAAVEIKQMQSSIGLMEEIIGSLPEFSALDSTGRLGNQLRPEQELQTVGPALRALNSFLNEADPSQIWGGLYKTPTPDGNILWLCDQHRQQYVIRALKLDA